LPPLELGMRFVKLFVAGSMLIASGMGAAAVEMVKPFEALEQTRRFNIELDKRQKRETAEQKSRDKQQEAQRKHEEAEQQRRAREEKAQQKAQAKRDAAAAKAAKSAHSPSTVPSKLSGAPPLPIESAPTAPPQATMQAAEPQAQVHSPPTSPQVSSSAAPPLKPSTTGQVDDRPQAPSQPAASPVQAQGESQKRVQTGNPPAVTTTENAVAAPIASGHAVAVSRLIGMDLHNERGDRLGDVERVLQSADGKFHIVIGAGGFLGMRQRDVRIPIDHGVTIRSDRLVIKGLTGDQVKAMPAFNSSDRRYRNLARNATVRIDGGQSEEH
jgi:hypothetical protein